MAEELGTKDVLEQVDARIGNVEEDLRALRVELHSDMDSLRNDLREGLSAQAAQTAALRDSLREEFKSEIGALRLDAGRYVRWLIGLFFAAWLSIMASMVTLWRGL